MTQDRGSKCDTGARTLRSTDDGKRLGIEEGFGL